LTTGSIERFHKKRKCAIFRFVVFLRSFSKIWSAGARLPKSRGKQTAISQTLAINWSQNLIFITTKVSKITKEFEQDIQDFNDLSSLPGEIFVFFFASFVSFVVLNFPG